MLAEPHQWIMSVKCSELSGRVLVQEFVDGEVTSAHFDRNLSTVDFDADSTGAELIYTFRLSHEHDLELLLVRIVVDILGQLGVNDIGLNWDVDRDSLLDIYKFLLLHMCDLFQLAQLRQ